MTRFLLLVAPAVLLLSCSPRVYYRTQETEGPQKGLATEPSTTQVQETAPNKPTATSTQPAPSWVAMPDPQPSPTVNNSPEVGENESIMDWNEFAATIEPKHAAFETAWAEIEEQWDDLLFSLRGGDPLFAPKSEFETEEAHRIRRAKALGTAGKKREALFADLNAQRQEWLTTPHFVRGTLTLNPDRYDAERELWKYTVQSGPTEGGIQRTGWWSVSPADAAAWSQAHPPGTADLVLEVLWSSSGIPHIIRAKGDGFDLEPQSWVHLHPDVRANTGWGWYDRGLLAGPFDPEPRPWTGDATGIPNLQGEKFNVSLFQSQDRSTLAKLKDHASWSQGSSLSPEDLTLFMGGMEFVVTSWREVHAMDISENGRNLLVSGATLHSPESGSPYFRWACMVVDPLTGKTKQLGKWGSNASSTHSALSHDVCLHPREPLACMTSIHKYGHHGLFSWNPEALGSAKVTTEIPDWAKRVSRDASGEYLLLHDFSGRIRLSTFDANPRVLSEWTCDKGLLDAHPASDGQHILTLESTEPLPPNGTVIYGEARLCIRKASNGNVIWSTPPFPIQKYMPYTAYHDLLEQRVKVAGHECVVTGMTIPGTANASTSAALYLLPIKFGTP